MRVSWRSGDSGGDHASPGAFHFGIETGLSGPGFLLWFHVNPRLAGVTKAVFSRLHLRPEVEAAPYLASRKLPGDFQGIPGVDPKYGSAAGAGGILFEMQPLEKGLCPSVRQSRLFWIRIFALGELGERSLLDLWYGRSPTGTMQDLVYREKGLVRRKSGRKGDAPGWAWEGSAGN